MRRRGGRDAAGVDPAEDANEARREHVGQLAERRIRTASRHGGGSVAHAASTSPCRPTSSGAAASAGRSERRRNEVATSAGGTRASCGLRLGCAALAPGLEELPQLLAALLLGLGASPQHNDPFAATLPVAARVALGLAQPPEPHEAPL